MNPAYLHLVTDTLLCLGLISSAIAIFRLTRRQIADDMDLRRRVYAAETNQRSMSVYVDSLRVAMNMNTRAIAEQLKLQTKLNEMPLNDDVEQH